MRAVIQRVSKAKVTVDDELVSEIGSGILILLGIKKGDQVDQVKEMAQKCCALRIFEDDKGRFNMSLSDVQGEALVIPQFTLLADLSRGRRPSFIDAEEPEKAKQLYELFISTVSQTGIKTKGGVFGARMLVALENNGPVTIIMES